MSWDDPQNHEEKVRFAQRHGFIVKEISVPNHYNVYTPEEQFIGQIHGDWNFRHAIELIKEVRTQGYCEGYDARGAEIRKILKL